MNDLTFMLYVLDLFDIKYRVMGHSEDMKSLDVYGLNMFFRFGYWSGQLQGREGVSVWADEVIGG